MHPTPQFAWTDREAMLRFVNDRGLCTIFVGGPFVVHVPVLVTAPDRLRFHVFRANRAAGSLEGARALLSCMGPDCYISPDWYGTENRVPTWNYACVEAEGPLRRLEEAELIELVDALSAEHERRLAPKTPWTSTKMDPEIFRSAIRAIEGFELVVEELRGTLKLGQNRTEEERRLLATALGGSGREDFAAMTRNPSSAAATAPRPS